MAYFVKGDNIDHSLLLIDLMFHLVRPRLAQIRLFSTTTEQSIVSLIQEHLKESQVHVEDTSGGCGTMFRIEVESNAFK